ncbi:MAG: hypothetical protein QG635_363 [Bacteroidota bacterium]|nr:hypothetical protein [Bacteroidota bacterium]
MSEMPKINTETTYTHEQICCEENIVYRKPATLLDEPFHYCPG